jgi:hypothetical protein
MATLAALPISSQIGLGLTAASTASQYAQSRNAATAARQEGEFAAKQENLAAVQREADRKERLARAMASQTASAGSRGVAVFEGSPLSVLQEDVRREEEATERDIFGSKLAASTEKIRASNQSKSLGTQANIGLLTGMSDLAKVWPTKKTPSK